MTVSTCERAKRTRQDDGYDICKMYSPTFYERVKNGRGEYGKRWLPGGRAKGGSAVRSRGEKIGREARVLVQDAVLLVGDECNRLERNLVDILSPTLVRKEEVMRIIIVGMRQG